jgi:hypothetical protein
MSDKSELNGEKENQPKLTTEELKRFRGFENISEIEAIDYIESMATFSMIVFEFYINVKSYHK